ncbi:HdeD family acid-resistance protein [Glaciihabitans sp. dw_435]|uniref:HdeD family acid-resistance protein n=1 Tax=Glaciihabitans sp. dw_435 TaxID=2720081 RepID=UPI001BD63330|nr:DUF308 domain-containing protein [Glaciihabitans sp. dw_435]
MTTPPSGTPTLLPGLPIGVLKIHRGELIAVAIVGLILGIIALFWPGATLVTVAILFGIYLITSGIFRITAAFVADKLSTGLRWLTGLLGLLVVAAGVICIAQPGQSLVILAFVIGFGWIAEGIVDIMAGIQRGGTQRWLHVISGIISVIGGFVTFALPGLAITAFVTIGAIILIVVSVSTLLTLPRADKSAKA